MEYSDLISRLPPSHFPDVHTALKSFRRKSDHITVVLDDDPTGNQTVQGVPVLLQWDEDLLWEEFRKDQHLLFLLTNSRSLNRDEAATMNHDIAVILQNVSRAVERPFTLISRSDSTLRGHYPAEPESLHFLFDKPPVHCIIPAFFQGGRVTLNDIHFVIQGDTMIPAAATPFARDSVFGYRNSNLKDWVVEKTGGKISLNDIVSLGIEELRLKGPEQVKNTLLQMEPGSVAIVNAIAQNDLDIFALGALMAEAGGAGMIYRTAASFINSYCAIDTAGLLDATELSLGNMHGGLIIAGSYVPKTTAQLESLIQGEEIESIEIDVRKVAGADPQTGPADIAKEIDGLVGRGRDVLIYTSREQLFSDHADDDLQIGKRISDFLVNIIKGIECQPSFFIVKGGITSHDIALRGLGAEYATVAGQALPGVPVWTIPGRQEYGSGDPAAAGWEEYRYIVFPGNVGDENALLDLYRKLKK
jgi:uncharacterized protein YgbK (DUF1537 family)